VKPVRPRAEIAVERLTAVAGLLPRGVAPIQSVAESDLLRRDEAQANIINFEIARRRSQMTLR
jgi:hypothetical protein